MSQHPAPSLSSVDLQGLESDFAARVVPLTGDVRMVVRESGRGPAVVCLHGIGSGAASWLGVAREIGARARLIAWDAPGYGDSAPLAQTAPRATDYVDRLAHLLDALGIQRCVLVGHSLGALIAGAAAREASALASRIERLVLLSPARGYGAPARAEQAARVRAERLRNLQELGIAGMAQQRSGRLVSEHADERARAWVRWNMARLNDAGYRQAIELLCGDDLMTALPPAMPVRVLCGTLDVVTTPEACGEVAAACGVPLEQVARAGHACYVEQPHAVADVLLAEVDATLSAETREENP